jgi:hypothetical protein
VKYDIEIVLPVTAIKEKYIARFNDLKKYGILNIQDKKVLITLLQGNEYIAGEQGWPKGVSVQVVSGSHSQETAKVYEFFGKYKPENLNARWVAKIDDDTCNDVSALVDHLDNNYDHERDYYVITEFRREQWKQEDEILKKIGFAHWFRPKNPIYHELEGSIVSYAGMHKILSDSKARQFMQLRGQIPDGYSDYALACAARICKIYPVEASFMSKDPLLGDFSLFGGHLSHIHEMCQDKHPHTFDLLKRMINKEVGGNPALYKELVNREFAYKKHEREPFRIVLLKDNGIIENGRDERIWHIKPNGVLEFLRRDATLITVFDNFDSPNHMEGYCVNPQGQEAILRRLAV